MEKIAIIYPGPGMEDIYFALTDELVKRGFAVEFITGTKGTERDLKNQSISTYNIEEAVNALIKNNNLPLLKRETLVEKYQGDLDKMYRSDFFLRRKSLDYKEGKTIAYLSAWEDYLSDSPPSFIINIDNGRLLRMSCYYANRIIGIPAICGNGLAPISGNLYWDENIMLNKWVKEEYLTQEISPEDETKISEYLNKVKQIRAEHGGPYHINSKLMINWFTTYGRNLFEYIFSRQSRDVLFHPIQFAKDTLLSLTRPIVTSRYYSNPDLNEKYIFMPLHFIDDAQITVRGFDFMHQDKVVEMCAKNIPPHYLLYIKEHPQWKGSTPLRWLKSISSLPNVRIVPPDTNAHNLIQNSQCVIIINSTVGWEALLYYKPVVVLGKPFYSQRGLTFDVESEEELPRKIREALEAKELNQEKVHRLINAVMKSLYNASYYYPGKEFEGVCNIEPQNISKIADSILTEYVRLKR